MVKKSHRENTVGVWAKQKLNALESYLVAYQLALSKQRFRTVFVDAFAGSGLYELRGAMLGEPDEITLIDEEDFEQQKEFIEGSPRRALGLERRFTAYRFIDRDPARVTSLQALISEYSAPNALAVQGDANIEVQKIARGFTARDLRGVAFLDPYGAHLHWDTVVALAATKKFDVIINCPIHMAIDRLVLRNGKIPAGSLEQLDAFFGTREWHDLCYGSEQDLFGGHNQFKRGDAAKRLLDLYVQQLRGVFKNVSKPSLVRNSRGHPLYYLIWAAENGRGAPIAEHILDLGAKVKVPPRKKTSPGFT